MAMIEMTAQPVAVGPLRQLSDYVRTRGLRATLRRLFAQFVFAREHYVLTYKPMDAEIPYVAARIPGTIRLAHLDDLERLRVFEHHYTDDQFRRWIEAGPYLYVFEHQDKLIGYRLITRELPRVGVAHRVVRLAPTDTWVVNAYTLDPYRAARIGSALASHILRENQKAGFRREVSLIRNDNVASRKMVGLAGAREIQEITYTRILGIARYQVRSAEERRYYYDGKPSA